MPPRTRKAESADEAQQQDPPVAVEPEEEDTTDHNGVPKNPLGAFEAAFDVAKAKINARVDGQIETLTKSMDDLAALLQAGQDEMHSRIDGFREEVVQLAVGSGAPGVPAVFGQVLELMRKVTEIGKAKEADLGKGGKYNFRGIDQAMDAVGAAMREVGLILSSEVVSSEHVIDHVPKFYKGQQEGVTAWSTTRVTMRYTFISPQDGSKHVVEGYGVGRDSADKDGSKAMSAAMKYALFQGLCIPVKGMNFDPEDDHPVMETETPRQPERQQQRPAQTQQRPAAAPQQQTAPPATPAPPKTDAEKLEAAGRALRAARNAKTGAQLSAIHQQASAMGILGVQVENLDLKGWLITINGTMGPATGGRPEDQVPLPPEPEDG
jgi:hypothetical protein